jgi:hypothetical protein
MSCAAIRTCIDRHFDGAIDPASERALRDHLRTCQACGGYYDRHLVLARLDPAVPGIEERIARGLGLGRRPVPRTWAAALALGISGVVAALLLVRPAGQGAEPAGFQARGRIEATARPAGLDAGQAVDGRAAGEPELQIYRVTSGRPRALLCAGERCGAIAGSDELAFAYGNAPGYAHLSIFGRDEHGHIYWFHPGWSDAAGDPVALAILPGGQTRELPESVAHRYDGRELTVHALFARRPLSARTTERLLAQAGSLRRLEEAAGGRVLTRRLPIAGGSVH